MEQKNWIKQYGVHIVICAVVIAIAFGFNQKINLDRGREYTVSSAIVLEKLTDFKLENGKYVFKGWGFDPKNYSENVKCELILQDTETEEALWPSMDKNPEKQVIEERYADGGDYSAGSFAAEISESKVNADSVYEILLRYTAEITTDESAEKAFENEENDEPQQYMVTVSTNDFLYNGQITEYNPKTFVTPEIAGTALEAELEGARLFHWFEEGMWVYVNNGKMYFVLDSNTFPLEAYPNGYVAVNWYTTNIDRIPEDYQQYQMGNADFPFMSYYSQDLSVGNYKVAVRDLPSEYVAALAIGFYDRDTSAWIYRTYKQLK